jgi:hypothetical protein
MYPKSMLGRWEDEELKRERNVGTHDGKKCSDGPQ